MYVGFHFGIITILWNWIVILAQSLVKILKTTNFYIPNVNWWATDHISENTFKKPVTTSTSYIKEMEGHQLLGFAHAFLSYLSICFCVRSSLLHLERNQNNTFHPRLWQVLGVFLKHLFSSKMWYLDTRYYYYEEGNIAHQVALNRVRMLQLNLKHMPEYSLPTAREWPI